MKMANSGALICLFLVALVPRMCQSQALIMLQVERLVKDLDKMVLESNADAKTFVTELDGLLDNLKTSATLDLANLDSTVNDFVTSVESKVDEFGDEAGDTDVTECTNLSTSVLSNATEILKDGTTCINDEVQQAEKEVELLKRYIDSQLATLVLSRDWGLHCVARFEESEKASSDAIEAFACVQPIHRSAQLIYFRFELIIDMEMTEDIFHGYETRVAECTRDSSGKLESLVSSSQDILEEISSCITKAIGLK